MRQRIEEPLALALLACLAMTSPAPALDTVEPPGELAAVPDPDALVPVPVAGPFEFPWSVGFLPDGQILVTEKHGRLWVVGPDGKVRSTRSLPATASCGAQPAGRRRAQPDPAAWTELRLAARA